MNATQEKLDALFPAPAPAPRKSSVTPTQLAGPTPESTDAIIEVLQTIHKKQHIFFNDRGFHKYVVVQRVPLSIGFVV